MTADTGALRAIIIGIDGGSWPLVDEWTQGGLLPNLASLRARGISGPLTSTTPPYTPPAWSTFMTGCNPGRHGIYDFVAYTGESYRPRLISGAHRSVPSLWRILSDAGLRVGVINVPFTYPPEEVNGYMISGMDAPGFEERSVYPKDIYAEVHAHFPDYNMAPVARKGESYDLDALSSQVDTLVGVALHLQETRPVDVLAIVFSGSDHVSHRCWRTRRVQWRGRTVDDVLLWMYQRIDQAIGRLLELAPGDSLKLVLSDHGFMGIETILNLNGALRDAGLLYYHSAETSSDSKGPFRRVLSAVRATAKRTLSLDSQRWLMRKIVAVRRLNWHLREAEIDWERTAIFTSGPFGMLRLNQRDREPKGWVEPGKMADEVLQRAETALAALRDPQSNAPLVSRLGRREEFYEGDRADEGPDAVVVLRPDSGCYLPPPLQGASTPALLSAEEGSREYGLHHEGTHAFDGVIIGTGGKALQGQPVRAALADLSPSLLAALDLPVPKHMDGRLIPELCGVTEAPSQSRYEGRTDLPPKAATYSEADEEKLEEHLRSLGYM
ncbi:MAG: alkaline phosphatase family protein [Proteobacteria bacterium]|nr:alkaline phosphatase family protein [Pseudomonadota bacterium]